MPAVLASHTRLALDFDFLVRAQIDGRAGSFRFVQIGANDGVSRPDDLIAYVREFQAAGVVVEPQPDVFASLAHNFAAYPGVALLNKAVHRERKSMTLYRFAPDVLRQRSDLPLWATTNGMASFSRRHVLNHARKLRLGPEAVQELAVECVSLDEVLALVDGPPDVLKIDVEGYDFELLDSLDLARHHPRIIRFENLHMTGAFYAAAIRKLSAAGYRFVANRMDTTAYATLP
ncbi:MAG TPA: FkbM family methyltransferase [candidate division Zixibacteria bacterium]|nr:FkbM family methyltransferase [candidate division Zixibacteria bacterium]HPI32554.1 FkbM family methyltransferase [candidate division Zixibacteria bacterium]